MKANHRFILREIAGEHILVPTGTAAMDFQGIITLNDTGLFIWNSLQEECTDQDLLTAVMKEYEVDEETAVSDIRCFLDKMKEADIIQGS